MKKIIINGKYDENNISQLVTKLNFIFGIKGKRVKDYHIRVKINIDDFTSIAALVIYKSFTYISDEMCIDNPETNLDEVAKLFSKFHLYELLKSYIKKEYTEQIYLKTVVKDDFFIAPHHISRIHFKNKADIEKKYYETIKNYYSNYNIDVIDCLKTLIVEISSNFYCHATDTNSVLMAEGNYKKIEIVSVDTSEGIIGTMKSKYHGVIDKDLIINAFKRGVSSKIEKGHCGTGLWLINEIVTKLKGKLILHTGGYIYRNIQGNITILQSTKWNGTILYVKIPINQDMGTLIKEILTNKIKYI